MAFAIGFGSTEQSVEENEIEAIREFCVEEYHRLDLNLIDTEFAKHIEQWVDARGKESRAVAERYKDAETYPNRYSSFYPTVLHDASNLVVILRFAHYNRRHALSPDGWALMTRDRTEVVLYTCNQISRKLNRRKVSA